MKTKILAFVLLLFLITKLEGQQVYFIENQSAKVQKSDYDGNNLTNLTTQSLGLYGIAIDVTNNKIYYTNVVTDEILTAALDGSAPSVLLNSSNGIDGPRGIAVDGVNNKIYWTEVISGKIKRADFNGSNISDIITGLSSPVDVGLDLVNNKLYWSDNGVGQKKISRSNLDGSLPEDIVTGLDQVGGIEVDAENGKLYWVDFGATDKVNRANTDGSSTEILVTIASGSPRGIAVDKAQDKLLWSDVIGNSICAAKRDGTLQSAIVSSLSHPIGVSTDWTQALPVELVSFTASVINNDVRLSWSTSTEVNNYGFEIERSQQSNVKSQSWEKIGFVNGHGNSNSTKTYVFLDKDVLSGNYGYRLKQIDTDGKFEYSQEIFVKIENIPIEFNLSQNYPNPFNPTTIISYSLPFNSKVSLIIYNTLGQQIVSLVDNFQNAGYYNIEWDASDISSGTYTYVFNAKSSNLGQSYFQSKKMVLVK